MTTRQQIALSALLAIPLSVNAPPLQRAVASAPSMAADHGLALGYLSSGDSYGWAWTGTFSAIAGMTCAVAFVTPPGAIACAASAAA
ncbi:MAG: hypothetical protein GEU99_19785 [Luteitalea sp.]|nr:hypothetical protein [Luteitalea sp.]